MALVCRTLGGGPREAAGARASDTLLSLPRVKLDLNRTAGGDRVMSLRSVFQTRRLGDLAGVAAALAGAPTSQPAVAL